MNDFVRRVNFGKKLWLTFLLIKKKSSDGYEPLTSTNKFEQYMREYEYFIIRKKL